MSYTEPTETLTSTDIWSVGKANQKFGEDKSLLIARPGKKIWRFPSFWFTIPEGFYALVTRHGALEYTKDRNGNKTPLWPAGFHYGPPWLKVSHLVTKQAVVFNTPVRGCRTKDNVRVDVDVAIVLRIMGEEDPENVPKFVYTVSAEGLQQQLIDAQAEAVRNLARSLKHTEVFGIRSVSQEELASVKRSIDKNRSPGVAPVILNQSEELAEIEEEKNAENETDMIGAHDEYDPLEAGFNTETGASVTQTMKNRLNAQFKPQGVEILDVIIQQIAVPKVIQQQMSNKTYVISQNAEQRMQQKYDLQTLRENEKIKTLKQKHQDMKDELQQAGQLSVKKEDILLQKQKAIGKAKLLDINTKKEIEVGKISAMNGREVQKIRDKTRLEAMKITENSKAKSSIMQAETKAKSDKIEAKADLECSRLNSEGKKARFEAEGISAPLNRTVNDHNLALKKLEAQLAMASNEKLIITGTAGGEEANRLILTEATLNDARKNSVMDSAETSAVLSQLAVASGNAKVRINISS
mmetsp:Transcript_33096/g.49964  ORF Transcript_33096/g.49964 Transcript_33096/m.49964 type:complete len:524 (-) Transcript_33096:132-1703(-)|eukprot:CAMPEP_0178898428 /NCGR_PEP_ID=MMETSP0786-20121207/2326_1 /TAXON_ID=186022 /ORGANISM="Thalassionema frauenfeldii, Strain CCMP 1798" /LENGTH=523 /DNA_ID=CAMNT_0020569147 /DNA_START=122 /DNA_END=1693 /DNA_ORIENTATION=+